MNKNKLVVDKDIIEACNKFNSMSQASKYLNIPFNTFKRHAIRLGVFKANQGGKGINKAEKSILSVDGLNNDKFPDFQSYKLKHWLWKHHIKENRCEICGLSEWMGKPIECALHHKDGNKHNNKIENLEILCPNCHSQTDNFTAKNYKRYK